MSTASYGIIYKATNNINKKIYIGQTTQVFKKRIYKHCWDAKKCRVTTYFAAALRAYNYNFSWEILYEASSREELNEAEKSYIWLYMTTNSIFGYNLTEGGCGLSSLPYKEERKVKQRALLKGKKRPKEVVNKIADSQRGVPRPKVARQNSGAYIAVDVEKILKLHNLGYNLVEISKKLKISKRIVGARLKWNNITPNPASNAKKEYNYELVEKLRQQGYYFYQIAPLVGVSTSVLTRNHRK